MAQGEENRKEQVWVCKRNIERFVQRLNGRLDPQEREILLDLLAKEEERLRCLNLNDQPGADGGPDGGS